MRLRIRYLLVVLFFIYTPLQSYSSNLDHKTISFDQFFKSILSDEITHLGPKTVGQAPAYYAIKGFIWYAGVNVEFNRSTDEYWDKRFLHGGERLVVDKGLAFEGCEFPEFFWLMFRNMTFNETVSFLQTNNIQMVFKDCVFKGPFLLRVNTEARFLEFENCTFERGFAVMEGARISQHLSFTNCTFKYNEDFIRHPQVHPEQFNIGELRDCPHYFYFADNLEEMDIKFRGCNFEPVIAQHPKYGFTIDLSHSAFKSVEITHCKLGVPLDLSFVNISNQFKIDSTELLTIAAEAISFNSGNAKIDWDNLKNHRIKIRLSEKHYLDGRDIILSKSKSQFETLISVYTLFYHTYKDQGNMLSANQVYVEWKNIETKYLRGKLQSSPTTQVWFNWFMNAFLKTFCDYGTNPFKSLMWSLVVMLVFTFIFMLYLWNFDTTEHKDIRLVFKNFGLYFVGGKSLIEIGEMMVPKDSNKGSANELREFIYGHKKGLPWYYRIFGLNIARPRITFRSMFYYRVADRILGKWEEASKWKRIWVAILVSLWIFGIFIKILLIRIFDAFTMSLNSFSTLGYGDLPRNEAMRYLSILEGFIGWFLLSIFSVSLISQIIQ